MTDSNHPTVTSKTSLFTADDSLENVAVSPPADADSTAPRLGEHCITDRPTPSGQTPTGEIRKLGDVDVYVSKPDIYPSSPTRFLLLLSSGMGLPSTNNRIQADKFAQEGFLVVMPDLFNGDPLPTMTMHDSEAEVKAHGSILSTVKMKAAEAAKSFMIDMWLARHTEEKVLPVLYKVIEAARDEFADAISQGGGIYAVGYCFGARYVLLLAAERTSLQKVTDTNPHAETKAGPFIKAGALAHATLVSRDDFVGLKAPLSLICVENDPFFPDDVRQTGEDMMGKEGVEHNVHVYPGVPHGFAVVGDFEDEHIKQAQVTAYEQMLQWIKEH